MIAEAPTVTAYRALPPLRPLAPALEALNLASRRPSPFATLEYLETFLAHDEHAGPGRTPLVLVLEDQGRVVGWVALSVHEERVLGRRTRRVSFLATHDVDRPGLVCCVGDEPRCAAAVWRHLLEAERLDAIELMAQDQASALLPPAPRPGWRVRTFDSIPNSTIALTHPSLARWFGSLHKKHRLNVGRLGRRLLEAGRVELLTARAGPALEPFLDLYLDVERRSWKGRAAAGIGRSPVRVALFRSQCAPGRAAQPVVHLLTLDGVAVAALFGVEFGGGLHVREITFDEGFADLAPGHLLMLLSVGEAIDRQLAYVNLLGFFGYYKTRWGATITPTRGAQLLRRWSAPWLAAQGQALGRALGRRPKGVVGETFNRSRREAGEPADQASGPHPERGAERALLARVLRGLPAGQVERLAGEALEAALPFRVAAEAVA